jgi:hypothetical protein
MVAEGSVLGSGGQPVGPADITTKGSQGLYITWIVPGFRFSHGSNALPDLSSGCSERGYGRSQGS